MSRERAPVLILGLGNPWWRDDGVGPAAVEALGRHPLPPGVELLDGGTGGLALLDCIAGREHLLVIDAADLEEAPGTVRRILLEEAVLQRNDGTLSFHQAGLAEVLDLARRLDLAPRNVYLFVVQPARLEPGQGLSVEVQAGLAELLDLVCRTLEVLIPARAGSEGG
ncbi:MAG: hydrogenase maturation protease [Chloroflexia bacterium]